MTATKYFNVQLTGEMLDAALEAVPATQVNRTRASQIDTVTGLVGELVFAEWFLGDWREHDLLATKGKVDFLDKIEIKTSAFPFSDRLNLLVREDYAKKRKPEYYVQIIINVSDPKAAKLAPGLDCIISGWATHEEVDAAPQRDFGSKFGSRGGYKCKFISIRDLRAMSDFPSKREFSSSL